MDELEIKFKNRKKALRFKRHLLKTHPSTRGMIKVENGNGIHKKRKGVGLVRGTNKFVNKMLKNSPNFLEEAKSVTML